MKKRIVIHVGPAKTGSSAIQYWLKSNRDALGDCGVYYPNHRIDRNGISSGNIDAVFSKGASGDWQFDQAKTESLLNKFGCDAYHTLVLSSEYFFHRMSVLNQNFSTAEFVIYLRHPLEQRESGYNQGIKRHGNTKLFQPPLRPRFAYLDILRELIDKEKSIHLILRPYVSGRVSDGAIIVDFLHLLTVDLPVAEQPLINLSYSFEALEFKRHANHFPLGKLSGKLDKLLQNCQLGQRAYSLLEPKRFSATNEYLLAQIEEFIRLEKQAQLQPYYDQVANTKQKPWRRQEASREELQMIADYIADQAPDLLGKLKLLAQQYRNLPLPNQDYYRCLGVEPARHGGSVEKDQAEEIYRLFNKNKDKSAAVFFRALALYLEECQLSDAAWHFSEAAFAINPEDELMRSKVNGYRVLSLQKERVDPWGQRTVGRISRAGKRLFRFFFNSHQS